MRERGTRSHMLSEENERRKQANALLAISHISYTQRACRKLEPNRMFRKSLSAKGRSCTMYRVRVHMCLCIVNIQSHLPDTRVTRKRMYANSHFHICLSREMFIFVCYVYVRMLVLVGNELFSSSLNFGSFTALNIHLFSLIYIISNSMH